jgi:hypothetical protein
MDDKEKGDDDDDDEPKEKKEPNDPFADGFGPYLNHSLDELFNPWKSPMNWLLLCTPFAYYGHHYGGDDVTVFILSVLAIAPMAERVSYVTEQLAMHTSETIGGLLNATFGNVTELIVSLVALFGGMLRIVQVSLLGSILSNLLLVLGCAFFVGGLKYPEQKDSHKAQTLSFSLLLLAVTALLALQPARAQVVWKYDSLAYGARPVVAIRRRGAPWRTPTPAKTLDQRTRKGCGKGGPGASRERCKRSPTRGPPQSAAPGHAAPGARHVR